jgi:flagellar biosynthesis anti-sigma factor FlgM
MTLPIDLNLSSQINSVASTAARDRASTSASGAEQLSADTANLSQISSLVAKAMEQPEVRMDKVESIQAQIAAGTYEVSPPKVADAMITSALNKDI